MVKGRVIRLDEIDIVALDDLQLRPFLISLLDKGEIEYSLVGRHRRIQADQLFKYKKERDEKRSKALADLAELDAEHL